MALFGFGKKNTSRAQEERPQKTSPSDMSKEKAAMPKTLSGGFSSVLLGTRVTEKASLLSEKKNVYTFNVSGNATKGAVSDAVTRLYKVQPAKVRIVSIRPKRVFVRGRRGIKSGGRKAYVYLKSGDKIDVS